MASPGRWHIFNSTETIWVGATTPIFDGSKHENAGFSSGRCLRYCRCNVLRAARRRIADIFAGLCRGLDARSHVARLRRHHRRCCFSADWALDDALSPTASIAELSVNSIHLGAGNFHPATRASGNTKTETMQFDDRGDHAQAEAQAFYVSTFV